MSAELKSLAHPEWPYTGTPNEWRGFAEHEPNATTIAALEAVERGEGDPLDWYPGETFEEALERNAVYQKQKFGPELT